MSVCLMACLSQNHISMLCEILHTHQLWRSVALAQSSCDNNALYYVIADGIVFLHNGPYGAWYLHYRCGRCAAASSYKYSTYLLGVLYCLTAFACNGSSLCTGAKSTICDCILWWLVWHLPIKISSSSCQRYAMDCCCRALLHGG